MKAVWFVAAALFVGFMGAAFFFGNRIMHRAVEGALRKALPGSEVSLKTLSVHPRLLTMRELRVKNKTMEFSVHEVAVHYRPMGLLRKHLLKVRAVDASLHVRGPLDALLPSGPGAGRAALTLNELEVAGLDLDVDTGAAKLKGSLSLTLNVADKKPLRLEAAIASFESHGLAAKNVNIDFDEKTGGQLSAADVSYQKLQLRELTSPFRWDGKTLVASPLKASLFEGLLEGEFTLRTDKSLGYSLDLRLSQLHLPALIKDFEFENKMSMTGRLLGTIKASGSPSGLAAVDGSLSVSTQGGDLVIRDAAFLQNIATRMKQPIELVEAGLKEYHYDVGELRLSKSGADLGVELKLDGPKGKRHLTTLFHDAV